MENREKFIKNLEGILGVLKNNKEYSDVRIFKDITNAMSNISKSFDDVVNEHIVYCFENLENVIEIDKFKENGDLGYVFEGFFESVKDKFIYYDENEKLGFDFEYVHGGDFYYDTLESIQEYYPKETLDNSFYKTQILISEGVNRKMNEMLDELNISVNGDYKGNKGIAALNEMIDYINEENDINLSLLNSRNLKKEDKEMER
ncbi:hypothetical protein [Streptobacillus moniliformis]|uniref:hypothetical protein n=1 Tax=Streptobacillus moniliformis TaxID=34105 RepID=UPI0007E4003C|nr:hypothetical protein [Streptobacillus moniliformis]